MGLPPRLDTATLLYVLDVLQEDLRRAEEAELHLEDPEENALLLVVGRQQGLDAAVARTDLLARLA